MCGGDGHTEALQLEYDPEQVSYQELVDRFFQGHRPRPSPTQYKSAIWYHSDEQKQVAEEALNKKNVRPGALTVAPAAAFYKAEEYHQKYIEKKR